MIEVIMLITTKNRMFHTTAWDTVKGEANMTVDRRLANIKLYFNILKLRSY